MPVTKIGHSKLDAIRHKEHVSKHGKNYSGEKKRRWTEERFASGPESNEPKGFNKEAEFIEGLILEFSLGDSERDDGLTLNSVIVQGLGKEEKKRVVSSLVEVQKPAVLFIQEAKLNSFNFRLVKAIGGSILNRGVGVDLKGASGGLLTLWKDGLLKEKGFFGGAVREAIRGVGSESGSRRLVSYAPNFSFTTYFERVEESKEEVIHSLRRDSKGGLIVKIDFEKAYDNIDFDFVDFMTKRMGFGVRWRQWIRWCISSSTTTMLVNGSPKQQFAINRGLRQEDSLSPIPI
ncbi:hypothetical protein Ddye_004070 [Dipteronia dyeriana]|uniref:Reverse transcriptase domain-containing protein n=1 Tax=Dipteronia dyeriana TaxID=168575 RepID=A0AAD9XU11_9ROSI|nr:hypothetical protein Ddye_004070 [Dipteronia dyeriana]